MNKFVNQFRNEFLKKQQLTYRRIYLDESENNRLIKKYKQDKSSVEKEYKFENDFAGNMRFYTEQTEEITDEELSQYISMKLIQKLDETDHKIYLMRNIMIFWLIINIFGFIGVWLSRM